MNNFIILTNSWLSIILFLIKNDQNDFSCFKYKSSFFENKWINQKVILLPSKLNKFRNLSLNKIIKSAFFWIFRGPIISLPLFKRTFSWEKQSAFRKFLLSILFILSFILFFKNITYSISIKKWIKHNKIEKLHFFIHFDILSYLFIKYSKNNQIFLYDDGLARFNKNYINWLLNKKIKTKINNIYLFKTNMKNIDYLKDAYFNKYIEIDLKKESDKIKLALNKFNFSNIKLNKNSRILVTQPLVDDGILKLDELLPIYERLVKENKINIIKVHPREKINWNKYFPNVKILKDFPLELLFLQIKNISNVSTIFSSSVPNFKTPWTSITFLGTKFNKKLIDTYGEFDELIL